MEETKSFPEDRQINVVKKIFFYLNASCFRILMSKADGTETGRSLYIPLRFCAIVNSIFEFVIIDNLFPHLSDKKVDTILIALLIFHGIIVFVFSKDVLTLSVNYDKFYAKWLFYLYILFLMIGLVGGLIILNNQIGHQPPGK